MQLQDDILTMFTAQIERRDGSPVIGVPEREMDLGTLVENGTYRIVFLDSSESEDTSEDLIESTQPAEPPVTQGERLEVEIEDRGEQGDGIARVGPGYVIFVETADVGDRVTVEVRKVLDNYAFAEVIEPEPIAG